MCIVVVAEDPAERSDVFHPESVHFGGIDNAVGLKGQCRCTVGHTPYGYGFRIVVVARQECAEGYCCENNVSSHSVSLVSCAKTFMACLLGIFKCKFSEKNGKYAVSSRR